MLIQGDDSVYLDWLAANPHGYVVNLRHSPSLTYAVLHRASCKGIGSGRGNPDGGFTERSYMKLVGPSIPELKFELCGLLALQGADFSKRCQNCAP